jgi:hypothetical protein
MKIDEVRWREEKSKRRAEVKVEVRGWGNLYLYDGG